MYKSHNKRKRELNTSKNLNDNDYKKLIENEFNINVCNYKDLYEKLKLYLNVYNNSNYFNISNLRTTFNDDFPDITNDYNKLYNIGKNNINFLKELV